MYLLKNNVIRKKKSTHNLNFFVKLVELEAKQYTRNGEH
jgi:hypothetical protein